MTRQPDPYRDYKYPNGDTYKYPNGDTWLRERNAAMTYKTQVIYGHPKLGSVLWATPETNEALVIVHCIETGRVPILDIRPYGPMTGPSFTRYDDELGRDPANDPRVMLDYDPQRTVVQTVTYETVGDPAGEALPWQTWAVPSSDGMRVYMVEERPDTRKGGTYLYCPCPSWKFKIAHGEKCKHVAEVEMMVARQAGGAVRQAAR